MTSGFDALSLALFTTLSPAGVVSFLALMFARLSAREHDAAVRIDRMVALPFSVVLVGFIASATHLGTPANALHVFSGVGRSPLSNEVLAAVAFLLLVGSYWMLAFKRRFPDILAKPWLLLAGVVGITLVVCTSFAYAVRTVPTWDTVFTPANLMLSALLAGPVLSMLFLKLANVRSRALEIGLFGLACCALIVSTAVLGLHEASLDNIVNNEFTANSLAPDYGSAIVAHLTLGIAGIVVAAFSLRRVQAERLTLILRITASVLVLTAVFLTRIGFYCLHMTIGF